MSWLAEARLGGGPRPVSPLPHFHPRRGSLSGLTEAHWVKNPPAIAGDLGSVERPAQSKLESLCCNSKF